MALLIENAKKAPLGRQLGALLYDLLLLLALFIALSMIFVLARRGEALRLGDPLLLPFRLCLLGCWATFYIYFWSAQGQTLGMRAWRLIVCDDQGHSLKIGRAAKRFLWLVLTLLPLGLGWFWRLWDRDGLSLYDRLAGTRLYYLPVNPYQKAKVAK